MTMKFGPSFNIYIDKTLKTNGIPMLLGDPGIGKSSHVNAYAKSQHTKCFTVACNQLADKTDLTGARTLPINDAHTDFVQKFFPHITIREAIDYANDNPRENPILFLDEINRTTADVTSALLSVATDRRIGSSKLPDNLKIIVAGNDKGNVTSLDEASISRFVPIHVEPDVSTFLSLDPDINPCVAQVLTMHPDYIFGRTLPVTIEASNNNNDDDDDDGAAYYDPDEDDAESFKQIATPRTIMGVSRWLNSLDKSEIMALLGDTRTDDNGESISALQEAIEGYVGHTPFGIALLSAVIASSQTAATTTTSNITVAKPVVYNELKAKTDRTALLEYVQNMTPNDQSGCLVYALHEKADNAAYITALSSVITKLEPDDMKVLAGLMASDDYDKENMQTLMASDNPLTSILSAFMA